jgi:hypothetical protein
MEFPVLSSLRRKLAIYHLIVVVSCLGCDRPSYSALLKWEDTSGVEDGFRIYRMAAKGRAKIAEVGANVLTYADKNPPPGSCYVVTAFNSAGESEPSNIGCLPR